MKRTLGIFIALFALTFSIFAQQNKNVIEVLYFKANLACCKAKACNALENDIKKIVEKSYPEGSVIFKEIKLSDETNKAIVEKYNATSQTVVIVGNKKKKEFSEDVSELVKTYLYNKDTLQFEQQMKAKIASLKNQK